MHINEERALYYQDVLEHHPTDIEAFGKLYLLGTST